MKELSGRELLKYMAQQAKNRMRGKNDKQPINISHYSGMKQNMVISSRINEDDDKKLYNKVCYLLDSEGDIFNPIDRLIDIDEYNRLNYQGKERYLFNLAEKYRNFKDKYEVEKLSKTV